MVRRGIPRGALANAAADNSAVPLDEARVCVGSPEKSLRQSLGFDEETTGSSIKRAQQAGAPASLLKRAQKKRKAQREAQHAASSGEGAASAAGDDGSPLDLTAELDGAAGSQKKKAKVVNPLAALRPPTREEAMVDGHRRRAATKAKGKEKAAAPAAAPAATPPAARPDGAGGAGGADEPDAEAEANAAPKRAVGQRSNTTTTKFVGAETIRKWQRPAPDGAGHDWMTWEGGEAGMKCVICLETGKSGDAFTTEEGCTCFMVKELQRHVNNHHKQGPSATEATVAAKSMLAQQAAEAGTAGSAVAHATRLAYMEQAYFLSKHATCSDLMMEPLLHAFDRSMKRLGVGLSATTEKRHSHGATACTEAFSAQLSADQLKDILESPLIGIAGDETTDVSVTE